MNKARLGIDVLTEMAVHVLCMGRPMYEARLGAVLVLCMGRPMNKARLLIIGINVLTEMAVLVLCMGRPMNKARLLIIGINVLTEMAVLVLCMGRPMNKARLGIDVGWQYMYCAWGGLCTRRGQGLMSDGSTCTVHGCFFLQPWQTSVLPWWL